MSNPAIVPELLAELSSLARNRLTESEAERVVPFMNALYAGAPPFELERERPDHLYAAAVNLLRFVSHRTGTGPQVRVFMPNLDDHGYTTPHTVVEILQKDMPFLVDSVSVELSRQGADIQLVLHPIFCVQRSSSGELLTAEGAQSLTAAMGSNPQGELESVIHLRVRALDPSRFAELERNLTAVLNDVAVAVTDFPQMREHCSALADVLAAQALGDEDTQEAAEFLRWMSSKEFVYIGYRQVSYPANDPTQRPQDTSEPALGILRDGLREVFDWRGSLDARRPLHVLKANLRSPIHRPVHLDVVIVRRSSGIAGDSNSLFDTFVGLFSLSAYSHSPDDIPLLRQKIQRVVSRAGYLANSYDAKTLKYILQTYPRDELFQIDEETLLEISQGILFLQHRQRVALFTRKDPLGRFVSCLVYIPRDRMDTNLRLRVQHVLSTAYRGTVSSYTTHLTHDPFARLHLIIKTSPTSEQDTPIQEIERRLESVTQSWEDRLQAALIHELGEQRGGERAREFAKAFPVSYREAYNELSAVDDVEYIERVLREGTPGMKLYRPVEFAPHQLRLKLYMPSGIAALSDIVPMLENMGLRVVTEVPHEIRVGSLRQPVRLQDFTLTTEANVAVELAEVRQPFIDVFGAVWKGTMGDDGFNKLVLHARLQSRDVKLVRAYARYLRQIRVPFSLHYMESTLRRHADFSRLLIELFQVKFDPAWQPEATALLDSEPAAGTVPKLPSATSIPDPLEGRRTAASALILKANALLDAVDNLDEDRILRSFLSAVTATTRTSFYQRADDGQYKDYLSLKFDSSLIEGLPKPRPFREIFVFGPRVEGVHLRFGRVARGGLRWSDRLEDFRTEVLGLVKAQQVKNAVIVPVGSKGGFVLQKPPPPEAGRDAFIEEGIRCYKTFIAGLLDVTDNRRSGVVVTPENVVAHDGDDPYLVVAADKGTATFSDIANEISTRRGFWLDDAFASGGSAGYDHKAMGITARGTWESVKRHFRELGKDIQSQPFTCCGVGDMSGDVFGNGLLLSKQTQLVAAFNHMHIFIDPSPDPAASWQERDRLFRLPRSSWADYNTELISEGGGVFDRKAKRIALSTQVRSLLGVSDETLAPAALISAILRCKVELLFFGGIGTYVKARSEAHVDVGDRTNDALRIDANELRAQVIGEGANLGMTQKGRIEYALGGGRCNTDFIDNSAGVDCSDHEVNIKILLSEVETEGEITRKQRNILLAEMTEDVATLVLRDNYLQTQTLSASHSVGFRLTDRLGRFIRALEKAGTLDRAIENLPDEEALAERVRRGLGFTRPELSVLLSYAKNVLYADLLSSGLPDDPFLEPFLFNYFPKAIRDRFPKQIKGHQLRREIIATVVTNDIVNRMGITFVQETREMTGIDADTIAAAFVVAREVLQMQELWQQIEQLDDQLLATAQAGMLADCGRCVNRLTIWLLRTHGTQGTIDSWIQTYRQAAAELAPQLYEVASQSEREEVEARVKERTAAGVPDHLALQIALLPLFAPMGDLVQLSFDTNRAVGDTARVYFRVGERFGLTWLRSLARRLPTERAWDRQAVAAVLDDLFATQRTLVEVILRSSPANLAPQLVIDAWCNKRRALVERNGQLVTELQSTLAPNFAMLAVANGQLKSLLADAQKSVTVAPPPSRRL